MWPSEEGLQLLLAPCLHGCWNLFPAKSWQDWLLPHRLNTVNAASRIDQQMSMAMLLHLAVLVLSLNSGKGNRAGFSWHTFIIML